MSQPSSNPFDTNQPWRVHITGAARSGTTLMLALMLSCFDIDGGHAAETRLWKARSRGRRIVLTKQPADGRLALFLARYDRRLHIVYMLRDPRDVVVSIHGAAPDRYWSNLRAWRDSVEQARRMFGHPRVHLVRYEKLATDPDRVQHELAAAMPFLRTLHPFSRFEDLATIRDAQWQRAMGSIRSISPESIGIWRKHLPRLKAQLMRHGDMSDDLIALGYETDKSWLGLLDGIAPDPKSSRTPDEGTFRRRFNHRLRDFKGAMAYLGQRILG